MGRKRYNNHIVLLVDLFFLVCSYFIAAYLRKGVLAQLIHSSLYKSTLAVLILAYIAVFELGKSKNTNIFKRGFLKEYLGVFKNLAMLICILGVYLFLTQQGLEYSRLFYFIFFIINVHITYVAHCYLKIFMLVGYKKSSSSKKVMLITISSRVNHIIKKMRSEYEWDILITSIGILDKDRIGEYVQGIEILANKDNLIEIARVSVIDEVFIHIPYAYKVNLEELILEFENMGLTVHLNVDIYNNIALKEKTIDSYAGYQVVSFRTKLFDTGQIVLKRGLDVIGGVIGLLMTGIITIFLFFFIKLESPGPLFFSQIRIGKNGRRFKIYKFRSMYQDAEERKRELLQYNEMNGLMFKMKDDPRITKVGKFIRKTSLDEFPQFLNVLKGEMSLVGTRPPTEDEFLQYEGWHKRRLMMKPGITGLWQVQGRNDVDDFEDVVKMDLEYIDQWSIYTDVRILLRTVFVVMFGVGAR